MPKTFHGLCTWHIRENSLRHVNHKEKWACTYVRKTFTTRMRLTQLSESFNVDLKNHLKSDLNLGQFFTHFERVVNRK
uniref:Protein FAR1-RELATED SEQUENCE n=1 Tax=Cajanus cajan TaxID=3821 RepID=A0A151RLE6_CAJCA|nr:hypothetical protein KK1_035286 [Cajanus cajan]